MTTSSLLSILPDDLLQSILSEWSIWSDNRCFDLAVTNSLLRERYLRMKKQYSNYPAYERMEHDRFLAWKRSRNILLPKAEFMNWNKSPWKDFPELSKVSIEVVFKHHLNLINLLSSLPNLEELKIFHCHSSSFEITTVENDSIFPHRLKKLMITNNDDNVNATNPVLDSFLEKLGLLCPLLECITVSIMDSQWEWFCREVLTKLKYLNTLHITLSGKTLSNSPLFSFPNIKDLKIAYDTGGSVMLPIFACFPAIESLQMFNHRNPNNNGSELPTNTLKTLQIVYFPLHSLSGLFNRLFYLEELSFRMITFTDQQFAELINTMQCLRKLTIGYCENKSLDNCFRALYEAAMKYPNLQQTLTHLSISAGESKISTEILKQCLPLFRWKTLHLHYLDADHQSGWEYVMNEYPYPECLQELAFKYSSNNNIHITLEHYPKVTTWRYQNVRHLTLRNLTIGEEFRQSLDAFVSTKLAPRCCNMTDLHSPQLTE